MAPSLARPCVDFRFIRRTGSIFFSHEAPMSDLPEMMNAIVATHAGGPEVLHVELSPRPSPREGEILIAVEAAGVNRPDTLQRQGLYPPPPGAPDILGLEVAGKIAALG